MQTMEDGDRHPSTADPLLPPQDIDVGRYEALGHPMFPGNVDVLTLHSHRVRQVLQDLNQSITPQDRWNVLQQALEVLSHDNERLHDYEVELGMDKALCLKLGYVVVVSTQSALVSNEISLICRCYLQVFQCSQAVRLHSFREVGSTELLPILIQLWTNIIQSKLEEKKTRKKTTEDKISDRNSESSEHDDAQTWIVKVLRVFSKLTPAKSCLINYLQGAYIGHLLRDMLVWMDTPSSSILYSSIVVLWETLGLLKDLTFRSRTDDKRILLTLEKGVLLQTIRKCCERIASLHPRIQEWCTAVIWNLALDPSICQMLLQSEPTTDVSSNNHNRQKDTTILNGLLTVLDQYASHKSASGFEIKIKRNATSAIGNIASDPENHEVIFPTTEGAGQSSLLSKLMHSVQTDSDSVVRRRAMRTIRCLAGSRQKHTVDALQHDNIPSFLVEVLRKSDFEMINDEEDDDDTQIQICQTVIALKDIIKDEIWDKLQTSLAYRIERTTSAKVLSVAVSCLSESVFCQNTSLGDPSVLFSDNFWKSLERAVLTSSETHSSVSKLLFVLAKHEEDSQSASPATSRPSVLTKTPVINTLTTILQFEVPPTENSGENVPDSRNQALQVVRILADDEINKKPLADNNRLLSGLVSLCLNQPDADEMKDVAKGVILQLVPEI